MVYRKNNLKCKKGITLISLVITVILILILAAVSFNFTIGKNGLYKKSEKSAAVYKKSQVQESLQMEATNIHIKNYKNKLTNNEIADKIQQDIPDIEWIYKDSLAGNYKGYDFTIVNGSVIMDITTNYTTKNQNDYSLSSSSTYSKYRDSITSITIKVLNNIEEYKLGHVTNDVEESIWDISGYGTHNIFAYLKKNNLKLEEDSSKQLYDLYIVSDSVINMPKDSSEFFYGFTNVLTFNGIENLNTLNVTNMNGMFRDFGYNMPSFNLGNNFDTSNVTSMSCMFYNCGQNKMKSLDLGNKFNTSKVKAMNHMFIDCGRNQMESLNLGDNFDTSSVTNMNNMFSGCGGKMTYLNLGNKFDTFNVIDMSRMFCYFTRTCSIKKLDLGERFDTSNCTDMEGMFYCFGTNTLEELNLGIGFDTSKCTNMQQMFESCGGSIFYKLNLGDKFKIRKDCNYVGIFQSTGNRYNFELSRKALTESERSQYVDITTDMFVYKNCTIRDL